MSRLFLLALVAAALTQTSPAQDAAAALSDFRESQYLTGQRVGCQMQTVIAIRDEDVQRVAELERTCAALGRDSET